MTDIKAAKPAANPVREAILSLVGERGVGKTICPSEAAQAVSQDRWRAVLKDVRAEAVRLAKSGDITIYRKGRPVQNIDTFKGVYRLGLPGKPLPGSR
ncbi:MAG: DUF3253 domain-containing protein [Pseudomonadota bacterium]